MKTKNKILATLRMALIAAGATSIAQADPTVLADNGVNLDGSGIIFGAPAIEGGLADDLTVAAEYILPASAFTGVKTDGGLINYNDLIPLTTNGLTVVTGAGAAAPTGTATSITSTDFYTGTPAQFQNPASGRTGTIINGGVISTEGVNSVGIAVLDTLYIGDSRLFTSSGGLYLDDQLVFGPAPVVTAPEMVDIAGGTLNTAGSADARTIIVSNYKIGKTEMTWQTYFAVYTWANSNGYVLFQQGRGPDSHPVGAIDYHHALLACNALSENQGLTPVYNAGGSPWRNAGGTYDNEVEATWPSITVNAAANGYRLPTRDEWEFAARSRTDATTSSFSNPYYPWGSRVIDPTFANYDQYFGFAATSPVGTFSPQGDTVQGLQDMSGNVDEYLYTPGTGSALVAGGRFNRPFNSVYVNAVSGANRGIGFTGNGFRLAQNN